MCEHVLLVEAADLARIPDPIHNNQPASLSDTAMKTYNRLINTLRSSGSLSKYVRTKIQRFSKSHLQ